MRFIRPEYVALVLNILFAGDCFSQNHARQLPAVEPLIASQGIAVSEIAPETVRTMAVTPDIPVSPAERAILGWHSGTFGDSEKQWLPAESPKPVNANAAEKIQSSPAIWGVAGIRGFVSGRRIAPNGAEFPPLFSLDLNFNFWLWRQQRVYGFLDTRFWGQKAAVGITNAAQGNFDFSRRELDTDIGLAWNYFGSMEARAFAFSRDNFNRGTSLIRSGGFRDGVGLENRWYVGGSYANLGQPGFDVARATFLSFGFYPSKEMVDLQGRGFRPGAFARGFLTYDLFGNNCYLFLDAQVTARETITPKFLTSDQGIALRPFLESPGLEFRLGAENQYDFQSRDSELTLYGSLRFVY